MALQSVMCQPHSLAVPGCLFSFSLTCVIVNVNKGTLLRAVLVWRGAVTWEPLTPQMSRFALFVPKIGFVTWRATNQ